MQRKFMDKLAKLQDERGGATADSERGPIFGAKDRLTFLLDAIKLVGTANGAGVVASVAALYYFSSRPELHVLLKATAIAFFVGLILSSASLAAYIIGLLLAVGFIDSGQIETKAVHTGDLNRAIWGFMMLFGSAFVALLAWGLSLLGTSLGLYVIVRFG
ncbi:hypothetical protein EAV90_27285 [Bradyrhizobium vignae]|nr:hypothetical protein EAV90_27285 [Bradyrhizobium vignae]